LGAVLRRSPGPGLVACGLGFAAGTGSVFLLVTLAPLWLPVLAAVLSVALAWRWAGLRPLAFACAGFLWAQVQVCQLLCEPFPEKLTGADFDLTGRIAGLPGESGDAQRFLLRVEGARADGKDIGLRGLVRLSWYRDAPALRAGERWRLAARLKPPHGFANPGGFDYERWLFQQGIVATGYVRGSGESLLLDPGAGSYLVDRWRQSLRDRIGEVLGGAAGEGLVRALVLGDRSGLASEQWEVLTRTGTNHLIAISGLHVGIVSGFLFFFFRWAWSRSARLSLVVAAPRAAAVAALMGALAYSALAGFAVSTQRALIMLAVVLGAVVFSRTIRPASGIVLALIGVLIADPLAVLAYGFWLSFGAVAALLYALGRRLETGAPWRQWGKAQWAVALGLLPLLLLSFGSVSLIAPAVNLIAVPLFSLVLLPGVLIASLLAMVPGLEQPLVVSARLLEWGFELLDVASGWTWATATLSWRPAWVWTAAFAGAVLLLAPRGLPGRWLGLVLLSTLPLVRPAAPDRGEARFTLLDVGQGLAAVVRTGRHTLVYDTGPRFPSGFNTGNAVVLPYLRHEGIGRIDTLVISHGDRDHAGGLAGFIGKVRVDRILGGEADQIPGGAAMPCRAAATWSWDGVVFEVLHPFDAGLEGNDSSCVLRVSTDGASVLLTGDVSMGVEVDLVAERPERLRSSVLVAAHHGSNTSTGAEFLEAVAPLYVLYGAGFANRFGFPAEAVQERVDAFGAEQISTAHTGAIVFRLGASELEGPWMYRREEGRLWTHRGTGADGPF
jgi:competence protein ComEC